MKHFGTRKSTLYIGTYTDGAGSKPGLFAFDADADGFLKLAGAYDGIVSPTYTAAGGGRLYAVSEMDGKARVSAFEIGQGTTGALRFLNAADAPGSSMCYISVWPRGSWISMANYGDGSFVTCALLADGRVGAPTQVIQLDGRGTDPRRQDKPYAHSIVPSPDGRFFLAADLGADRVYIYGADASSGLLSPNEAQPFVESAPGDGPRHIVFSPGGRHAYLVTEMGCRVMAFAYDAERGTLDFIQAVSTLPDGWAASHADAENTAAAIRVSADGKFLYASNRGADSIAAFAVDPESGKLDPAGHFSSRGHCPRDFCLSPDGAFVAIANQATHSVFIRRRDAKTGAIGIAEIVECVNDPAHTLWL